jgi:hypothetical protein
MNYIQENNIYSFDSFSIFFLQTYKNKTEEDLRDISNNFTLEV